jgi:Xaa-Pro aminopeptidase
MPTEYGMTKVRYDWEHRKQYLDMPFETKEYQRRVEGLRRAMADQGLDYLLVYSNPGCGGPVRYVSNFDTLLGNSIVVLPLEGDVTLVTDSVMHSEPMHSCIWTTWIKDVRPGHLPGTVRTAENIGDFVVDALREKNLLTASGGLANGRSLPYQLMGRLAELLPEGSLVAADPVFESVRAIKSDDELAVLRKSARYASIGLDTVFDKLAPGVSEVELRAEAVYAMAKAGADMGTFALTSGPRAGLKHGEPTDRRIEEGEMLFIDVCAPHRGYMSDVARSGVLGKANQQQKEMLETALEMRDSVVRAVRPGASICDLQQIAEGVAQRRGLADYYYPTGFGHGIGTSVAEWPMLFPDNEAQLEENMVFSLEPMIVIEGVGTAVFEDMILVTSRGTEVLSDARIPTW